MSSINQKEYLKKYLSSGSDSNKKKKRKKKPMITSNRINIIDDDIDVNLFNRAVEEDMYVAGEDAPQIVGVIDDRPPELRIDDYRNSDMWKPVGLSAERTIVSRGDEKADDADLSPGRIKTEVDGDHSPPRRRKNDGGGGVSPKRVKTSERKELSGAAAKTVYRDKKTGKVRDFEKEAEVERKDRKKVEERSEKYTRWGRGLKQVEDYTKKLTEDLHEMNKPLARYADDEDLEKYLKEQERDGDPMLAYMRKKKKKEYVESDKPLKPQYEGEFMPNRYGIRPGHRWDGVDRSNGYETKWIERINSQYAQQEDVYKWSTEDM